MVTRLSTLFFRSLREDPSDAEVLSHRLLVRAGYIRRQAPGIFAWLPLGVRVKARIEQIIREEMAAVGAQEVHFPALLPAEPYQLTGRYEEYGPGMFRLYDRKHAQYVLAPTHEEFFTLLVKDLYSSYKDFPLTIYQIHEKYRDEPRPRAGLLRGREFTMKDAYSFDHTDAGLDASYKAQRDAYERIFSRLGVEYVIVQAHSGAMGGSKSEEFLHPTPVGEDTFVYSPGGYAANVEAYTTPTPPPVPIHDAPQPHPFPSPNTPTITSLVEFMNAQHPRDDKREWAASDMLKNIVLALVDGDGSREIVVVGIPADRDVDHKRATLAFSPMDVEPATEADFATHPQLVKGYIGPWSAEGPVLGEKSLTGIRYLCDPRIVDGSRWVTGANVAHTHVRDVIAGRDFCADSVVDIATVHDGDPAPDGSGPITSHRGMEVGHVFQLGRKYADAFGLQVLDENGKRVTVTMGSYGIGVSRILAVIAEKSNDDRGLVWPEAVTPFDVHVIATGKTSDIYDTAEKIINNIEQTDLSVLYDDRVNVSAGVKFGDAELIGVPKIIIVGRGVGEGVVELWDRRTGKRESVPISDAAERVKKWATLFSAI